MAKNTSATDYAQLSARGDESSEPEFLPTPRSVSRRFNRPVLVFVAVAAIVATVGYTKAFQGAKNSQDKVSSNNFLSLEAAPARPCGTVAPPAPASPCGTVAPSAPVSTVTPPVGGNPCVPVTQGPLEGPDASLGNGSCILIAPIKAGDQVLPARFADSLEPMDWIMIGDNKFADWKRIEGVDPLRLDLPVIADFPIGTRCDKIVWPGGGGGPSQPVVTPLEPAPPAWSTWYCTKFQAGGSETCPAGSEIFPLKILRANDCTYEGTADCCCGNVQFIQDGDGNKGFASSLPATAGVTSLPVKNLHRPCEVGQQIRLIPPNQTLGEVRTLTGTRFTPPKIFFEPALSQDIPPNTEVQCLIAETVQTTTTLSYDTSYNTTAAP